MKKRIIQGTSILLLIAGVSLADQNQLIPTRIWNDARADKVLVTVATKPVTIKLKDGRTVKANIPILVERSKYPTPMQP